jgi:hypothetical protein
MAKESNSSGFRKTLWVIVASVAGIAVGGFASRWLTEGAEASSSHAAPAAQKPEPRGAAKSPRSNEANKLVRGVANKLGDIEARVQRLEQPTSSVQPAQAMQEMPTAESYHQRHAETIRQHRAEPVDPDWGPRTTELFNADLERLADFAEIQIGEVECRTESCRAVVRWDSMDTATANYQRLVVTPVRVNCTRTILLPEADQVEGAVEATLVFDCAEWKATGSQPLPADMLPDLPAMPKPD